MNRLEKLAVQLGMTTTEIMVTGFLLSGLVLGITVNLLTSSVNISRFTENDPKTLFSDTEIDSLLHEAAAMEAGGIAPTPEKQTPSQQNGPLSKTTSGSKVRFIDAGIDELTSIPGISKVLAGRLITFRKSRNGNIERFQDFLEVKGIGRKRLEILQQHLILQ
ncbi:ComEA-related protein [Prosthecochloris aestuarii DSM 271]|uniref:ComEA-related protein n=1 Tax=Prosthecochloris aestuarii (strain DSM 271 / SK 413) TaxID=290512 RepID=B4S4R3_PROA2|nr:helix-hairpin-helix domain-containing protein [Prosthecochloris aestuarii]ACF46959.1 ComEA-related protein [Prosthecochloris aestuarii DSM 271]